MLRRLICVNDERRKTGRVHIICQAATDNDEIEHRYR
jgi:hypothetical protein